MCASREELCLRINEVKKNDTKKKSSSRHCVLPPGGYGSAAQHAPYNQKMIVHDAKLLVDEFKMIMIMLTIARKRTHSN